MKSTWPSRAFEASSMGPTIGTPRRALHAVASSSEISRVARMSALPAAGDAPQHAGALQRVGAALVHGHDAEIHHVERAAVGAEAHRDRPLQAAGMQPRRRPVLLAGVGGELFD